MGVKIEIERLDMIKNFELPKYREIPNVGLYLDQVSKYLNEFLNVFPESSITNSMISNYVKKKLISNPIKKQYNRDQIAYLLFIAITKSTLSLENMGQLFDIQKEKYSVEEAYNYFAAHFDTALKVVFGLEKNESLEINNEEKELLHNIVKTVAYQIYIKEAFASLNEMNQ